jgi:hypothetical protein
VFSVINARACALPFVLLVSACFASRSTEDTHLANRTSMLLEEFQAKTPFSTWVQHVNPMALGESRRIYKTMIAELAQLSDKHSKDAYIQVLSRYIEDFNQADEKHQFISTIEREDICEHLEEVLDVLKLSGIDECDDLPVARDW